MYFQERVLERLRFLRRALEYLESRRDVTAEEMESNYELRSAIERNFQVVIEAAIDVGEMVIAEEGAEPPETNKEVFLRLGDIGVLPKGFAERIADMAGFRNLLVHQYGYVDAKKLQKFLIERLNDFREFENHIMGYLRRKGIP